MVLPRERMERFQAGLGFYRGTVPSFEQYTLARFLRDGHFEKHLNRMRKYYRALRNRVLDVIENSPYAEQLTITEENAGLHFLVKVETDETETELLSRCRAMGLRLRTLSGYYHGAAPLGAERTLVINYSGLDEKQLEQLGAILRK